MKKNEELRQVQLTELEILKKIDSVCKKNKIKYFLIGGTLLGAVRHDGFIPWDDDIDIGMLREDYDKFIRVCNEGSLGKDYFMQCFDTDPNYYLAFGKVRKNNTSFCEKSLENYNTHKGIFVDIFPYDYVPTSKSFKQKLQAFIFKNISDAILFKKRIYKLSFFRKKMVVAILSIVPTKLLIKIQDMVARIYNNKNCDYIVCLPDTWGCEKTTFHKSMFFPLKKIKFEDENFSCLKEVEEYLTKSYGDYMKLPKEEDRKTHLPTYISFTKGEEWHNEN